MNTAKIYHDSDGDERTILQMVTLEKEWAANRIQEGEKAIERVSNLEGALRVILSLAGNKIDHAQIYGKANIALTT